MWNLGETLRFVRVQDRLRDGTLPSETDRDWIFDSWAEWDAESCRKFVNLRGEPSDDALCWPYFSPGWIEQIVNQLPLLYQKREQQLSVAIADTIDKICLACLTELTVNASIPMDALLGLLWQIHTQSMRHDEVYTDALARWIVNLYHRIDGATNFDEILSRYLPELQKVGSNIKAFEASRRIIDEKNKRWRVEFWKRNKSAVLKVDLSRTAREAFFLLSEHFLDEFAVQSFLDYHKKASPGDLDVLKLQARFLTKKREHELSIELSYKILFLGAEQSCFHINSNYNPFLSQFWTAVYKQGRHALAYEYLRRNLDLVSLLEAYAGEFQQVWNDPNRFHLNQDNYESTLARAREVSVQILKALTGDVKNAFLANHLTKCVIRLGELGSPVPSGPLECVRSRFNPATSVEKTQALIIALSWTSLPPARLNIDASYLPCGDAEMDEILILRLAANGCWGSDRANEEVVERAVFGRLKALIRKGLYASGFSLLRSLDPYWHPAITVTVGMMTRRQRLQQTLMAESARGLHKGIETLTMARYLVALEPNPYSLTNLANQLMLMSRPQEALKVLGQILGPYDWRTALVRIEALAMGGQTENATLVLRDLSELSSFSILDRARILHRSVVIAYRYQLQPVHTSTMKECLDKFVDCKDNQYDVAFADFLHLLVHSRDPEGLRVLLEHSAQVGHEGSLVALRGLLSGAIDADRVVLVEEMLRLYQVGNLDPSANLFAPTAGFYSSPVHPASQLQRILHDVKNTLANVRSRAEHNPSVFRLVNSRAQRIMKDLEELTAEIGLSDGLPVDIEPFTKGMEDLVNNFDVSYLDEQGPDYVFDADRLRSTFLEYRTLLARNPIALQDLTTEFQLLQGLSDRYRSSRIFIDLDFQHAHSMAVVEPELLVRICREFFQNAIAHNPPDRSLHIELAVRLHEHFPLHRFPVRTPGVRWLELHCRNDGNPIPNEWKGAIFRSGVQVPSERRAAEVGGYGLAIVRSMVERSGGSVGEIGESGVDLLVFLPLKVQ